MHKYNAQKTGELSGDLCRKCGSMMIIDKTWKDTTEEGRTTKIDGKKVKVNRWTIRCQYCGREVPFSDKRYNSAYK